MKQPIKIYEDISKEIGLTDTLDVMPISKMTFIQEQVGQQRAVLNRLLFDATIARYHQEAAKDETMKNAHRKKVDDYLSDARQIKQALEVNIQLIEELRAKYPELSVED